MFATQLKCSVCGKTYKLGEVSYKCGCGANLNVQYDYDALKAYVERNPLDYRLGMFRYMPFIPLRDPKNIPNLSVGNTPLYDVQRLADDIGVQRLFLKDEGRNPTGSLKDRASALIVALAKEEGRELVATASTGNAGAALAGLAAAAGMKTVILVPKTAPQAKIAQLQIYGARVGLVDGSYDDAFFLCEKVALAQNWYCRNTGANPYTVEGKKTVSLELCEQLASPTLSIMPLKDEIAHFVAPDYIFVSVGDGNIISGVFRGIYDLFKIGAIDHMPRIVGVQSDKSNALARAWKEGKDPAHLEPIEATTRADSIAADLPSDPVNATRAVNETKGFFIEVTDDQILSEIPTIARLTGVFAEPAASCAVAGLRKAVIEGLVPRESRVAVLITGTGLKDIRAAMSVTPAAPILRSDDEAAVIALSE